MPTSFPCPNTQCNYQFDADVLPARAWVTCPLCRTRFKYEAAATHAPAPSPADNEEVAVGPRVVNLRNQPKRGGFLPILLWTGGFVLVFGGLIGALMMWNRPKTKSAQQAQREERLNLSIDPFGEEWQEDTKVRATLNVNVLARKKVNADVWLALYAQDFGERNPRPGELRDQMKDRLKAYAGSSLTMVEKDGVKWLGQPAIAFQFQGDFGDAPVVGECLAISYQGIGYALFNWARDREWDAAKDELATLRNKIQFVGSRPSWAEKKSNTQIFVSADDTYQLEDPDGVWKQARVYGDDEKPKKTDYNADPKEIDPNASMAFKAQFQIKAGGDARQRAAEPRAVVLELPKADDALAAAKAHLVERIKKTYSDKPPEVTLENVEKSPSGLPLPTDGPSMARLVFRDPLSRGEVHFYILSARTIGDKTIVVETDVDERHATYVEGWMMHLAASLKAK